MFNFVQFIHFSQDRQERWICRGLGRRIRRIRRIRRTTSLTSPPYLHDLYLRERFLKTCRAVAAVQGVFRPSGFYLPPSSCAVFLQDVTYHSGTRHAITACHRPSRPPQTFTIPRYPSRPCSNYTSLTILHDVSPPSRLCSLFLGVATPSRGDSYCTTSGHVRVPSPLSRTWNAFTSYPILHDFLARPGFPHLFQELAVPS